MLILQRPEISLEEVSENRSVFTIEPLEPGFGLTLGNTMRRALLSRVPGVAVTGVKIEGVNHEFTSIPGVIEDVLDVLLNLKRLVLRVEDLDSHTLTVKAKGPGEVKAAQIQCPAGVEVINTDLTICSLSNEANLDMEVSIAHGVGYMLADKNKPSGSIKPSESISSVGKTLGELWKLFADIDEGVGLELGELTISEGSSPDLSLSVDALDLSERPRNCLGRENITTVGQILEYTEDDLLNLTNFGQKSLDELVAKLDELGLSLPTSSDLDSGENSDA